MKITKSQLKQIIKEEMRELDESTWSRKQNPTDPEGYNVEQEWEQEQKLSMGDTSDQMVIDKVWEVTTLFADLYNGLPDDESKELFEHWLNANVQLYTERWQEERGEEPEDWRSTPGLPEELP
jgi:hypothetical protein